MTRRRGCLCCYLEDDWSQKKVQVSHIDRNPQNNHPTNLVPLCLNHHDEYDSSTSQSKGITKEEIIKYKKMLIEHYDSNLIPDMTSQDDFYIPDLSNSLLYTYGLLLFKVTLILYRYDPIGLQFGCNADEYSGEARAIINILRQNPRGLPTSVICKNVFTDYFTKCLAENFNKYQEMAEEIEKAWMDFKELTYYYQSHPD